jgi:GAF domain-containing protein
MADLDPLDPMDAFAQLGRIKLSETDLDGVLNQIAALARRSIPGAAEVSVTLIRGQVAQTPAFTSGLALTLGELQHSHGDGPGLTAAQTRGTVSVPDLAGEHAFPRLAQRAVEAGYHSLLSVGLPVDEQITGALNISGQEPGAFDDDAVVLAQAFAGYAAVAMANAHLFDASATLARRMQATVDGRVTIEQAKGVLMGTLSCTAEDAFAVLTRTARESNRRVQDVAAAVLADATANRSADA